MAFTGQVIGSCCCLGDPSAICTLIDPWLERHEVIWAAAGHPHTVFPTSYAELIRIMAGTVANVGAV